MRLPRFLSRILARSRRDESRPFLHVASVIASTNVAIVQQNDSWILRAERQSLVDLSSALRLAISDTPSDASLYVALAAVHQILGDDERSDTAVKEAIRREPTNPEPRRMLRSSRPAESILHLPPWTEDSTVLHPLMCQRFIHGDPLQFVRYRFTPTLAIIVRKDAIEDSRDVRSATWDAFLSSTPYGNIAAHYAVFQTGEGPPSIAEAFLALPIAPRDDNRMDSLFARLAHVRDAFIILVDSSWNVAGNFRYHLPSDLRKRLREIVTGLHGRYSPPTTSHLDNAARWHMDHFSLASAGQSHVTTTPELGDSPRRRIRVGIREFVFDRDMEFHFAVEDWSEPYYDKNILIVQEPHFSTTHQWRLFEGIRLVVDALGAPQTRLAFLAEGYEALKPLSVAPLVAVTASPSNTLIHRVLESFLIPGYVAFEWKHQVGVSILGSEDMSLYGLSAELWETEDLEPWHATVVERNKAIADTIEKAYKEYDCVVAFVGGMHLNSLSNDVYEASSACLDQRIGQSSPKPQLARRNLGISDYLKESGIGYTYLATREGVVPSYTEADFALYQKLFACQRRGTLEEYVDGESQRLAVTVSPSVSAAADFAGRILRAAETGESKEHQSKRRGRSGDGPPRNPGSKRGTGAGYLNIGQWLIVQWKVRSAFRRATKESGKGNRTDAGIKYTKHACGQRAGSKAFPELEGGPEEINKQAAKILKDILNDPNRTTKVRPGKGGDKILQVNRPDGTGAIFKSEGWKWTFSYFAENLY